MPSEALQYLNDHPDFINHDHDIPTFYRESDGKVVYVYTTNGALIDERQRHSINAIIIHSSVEVIDVNTFKGFSRVELVEFQANSLLHTIGEGAFENCFALTEIDMSLAREINNCAFSNCLSLSRVTFGSRLRLIGRYAFHSCISLVSVIIPSVDDIEFSAFRGCRSLTTVELPEEVRTIQEYSFAGCRSLTRIVMPLFNNRDGEVLQPNVFFGCNQISRVELRLTPELVPYLGDEINNKISLITDVFRATRRNKTDALKVLIGSVCNVYDQHIATHYDSMNTAELLIAGCVFNMMSDDEHVCITEDSIGQELESLDMVRMVVEEVKSYLQLPLSMTVTAHGAETEYTWRNGRLFCYHYDSSDDDCMCSNESDSSSTDSYHYA